MGQREVRKDRRMEKDRKRKNESQRGEGGV